MLARGQLLRTANARVEAGSARAKNSPDAADMPGSEVRRWLLQGTRETQCYSPVLGKIYFKTILI